MNYIQAFEVNKRRCGSVESVEESKVYTYNSTFDADPYRKFETTTITVINQDCLEKALEYKDPGKTLLLNMGNPTRPGGYLNTVGAQEEDLFRRTDICLYLNDKFYPLDCPKVILSKDVKVFSSGLRKRYIPLPEIKRVNIITCSAIINWSVGTKLSEIDENMMTDKIHTLFQAAVTEGYTTLVLSALGCGGFRCPPEHISLIFKKVLEEFQGCFEIVTFAIFDQNYPKCNFAIFKEVFEGV